MAAGGFQGLQALSPRQWPPVGAFIKLPALRVVHDWHTHPVTTVAFAPDDSLIATGSEDTTIKIWNINTRQVKATLRGHSTSVTCLAFSPDGKTLASGSGGKPFTGHYKPGQVKLWDVSS